jgi:hypothetical protein
MSDELSAKYKVLVHYTIYLELKNNLVSWRKFIFVTIYLANYFSNLTIAIADLLY